MKICMCMKYEHWEMWEIVGNLAKIDMHGKYRCEITVLNMLDFFIY
jgi:hypothetical protein